MVVNNPNNWHWVEKNTLPWAQEYLSEKLSSISLDNSTHQVKIQSTTTSGDCNVSQRKGKVICIFDLALDLTVEGISKDEENKEFGGSLRINDFMHDEEDYVYEFSNFGEYKPFVESEFLPLVLKELRNFQYELINAHSKDVQENVHN